MINYIAQFFIIVIATTRLIIQVDELEDKESTAEHITICNKRNNNQYTGYLKTSHGLVSFMHYQVSDDFPTVIYIGGGPGMSSQLANFLEIGPYIFNGSHINENNNTWTNFSNLLFLDLPPGSGFGQVLDSNKPNVVQDYEECIAQLISECGIKMDKIYIFTSDYGAKWVVEIANKHSIKGIGLLDPFLDPKTIFQEVGNYGFNLGLLDYQERQKLERRIIVGCDQLDDLQFELAGLAFRQVVLDIQKAGGGVSPYNIQTMQDYKTMEDSLSTFLNINKEMFGFNTQFVARSKQVYYQFSQDFMSNSALENLSDILIYQNQNVNVLIYQSQFDLMIPCSATMRWLHDLNQFFKKDFNEFNFKKWTIRNKQMGLLKKAGKLEYKLMFQSGQLMHRERPIYSFELAKSFVLQL